MKRAEDICANVSTDIKPQAITLANAVLAMQNKIDQQIPIYEQMPLAQQVTALNNLQDILSENKSPTSVSDMSELRKKFKIAK